MVKILIADPNETQTTKCCKYISNNKDLKAFGTNTGISTFKTYMDIRPNIFFLSLNFDDINGIEVMNRLRFNMGESNNCNTIITINNMEELFLLRDVSKVSHIMQKPSKQDYLTMINQMCSEYEYPQITTDEIEEYLLYLGFNLKSSGMDYMKSAIELCFYFPNYLSSLEGIFQYLAKQYDTKTYAVRNAIRASLKPLNNYLNIYDYKKGSLYNLFNKNIEVTPKRFLEISVVHFHLIINKKNNKYEHL